MKEKYQTWLNALIPVARQAGDAILKHYAAGVDVIRKEDGSPTTAADTEAERIIVTALQKLTPTVPIIAEEAVSEGHIPVLPDNATFWLIDPLDGTKEFLNKTGEFTVNIGLIEQRAPTLGIIYVPVTDTLYYGARGLGACRVDATGTHTLNGMPPADAPFTVVTSRSHRDGQELKEWLPDLPPYQELRVGSSLKFCMIAEGKAHLYARAGTTMEWDTAAGDAIVRAVGLQTTTPQRQPFYYQKQNFINAGFLVSKVYIKLY